MVARLQKHGSGLFNATVSQYIHSSRGAEMVVRLQKYGSGFFYTVVSQYIPSSREAEIVVKTGIFYATVSFKSWTKDSDNSLSHLGSIETAGTPAITQDLYYRGGTYIIARHFIL